MAGRSLGASPITYARIAGLLYLIIFLIAPFAEFVVRGALIVPGDAAATAANIRESEGLFRAGFATDLAVFVIEVAQSAILYVLLRPVSQPLALVMAFARLAQATILGLNLLNMHTGLQLLTAPAYAGALSAGQLDVMALVFLDAQSFGYELGLVFFALHLAVLGFLVYQSGFLPRLLGVLLVVSAIGYVANSAAVFLVPDLEETMASVVVLTALVGELPLTLWLLVKGLNVARWQQLEHGWPPNETRAGTGGVARATGEAG